MQHFARRIAQELGQADPSHAQDFQRRAQEFIAQLQELDGQYRRRLADLSSRYIVTYHSAFGYLARRYGLEPISVYGIQGDGLGSSRIESVTDFIRRHNVKVLFTEPQYPPEKLQDLARRMGLRLAALDDLGSPDRPGYTSYLEMMRTNLDTLERNLKD
jgi:zinc transport system substrate-binding protein